MTEHVIATDRLTLQPLREEDADLVCEAFMDARLYRYAPELLPADATVVRRRFRGWTLPPPAHLLHVLDYENWLGSTRATAEPVGTFQATLYRDGSAAIAYTVFVAQQHRGYAVETARALIAHMHDGHAMTRVFATIHEDNAASIAVARGAGLTYASASPMTDDRTGTRYRELLYERTFAS